MGTTDTDKTEATPQEGAGATPQHDVFISCTPDDQALAEAISAKLKQRKFTTWYPLRDLVAGEDEQAQIDTAIRSSKALVLAFTDAANKSEEILREMSVAIAADIEVVPFKLTSTLPVMGLEYYLSTVPWVDGTTEPIEESARSLAVTVSQLVRKPSPANKLTELWARAKAADGSDDISDMGVPVTIVIPEQGSWETEGAADGTQETAMVTDGVPVTIVYPEAECWALQEKAQAEAEAASEPEKTDRPEQKPAEEVAGTPEEAAATPEEVAAAADETTVASDTEAPAEGEPAETQSPEEELLAVSVEAAKQLHHMAKKEGGEPTAIGDVIKVVLALLLAAGTLLYLLATSVQG